MAVKKKGVKRKIVKKKKDLKKGGNKLVNCKAQASLVYNAIDEIASKEARGEGTLLDDWYYGYEARIMRWFDSSNNTFKILESLISAEKNLLGYIEKELPERDEPLASAHELIIRRLVQAKEKCDDIRISIFYIHGKEFNLKYNKETKEYYL